MQINKKIKSSLVILIFCFLIFINLPAKGCTLWAATGSKTKDGITLITKNRDWKPDNCNELRVIIPQKGLKFLALYGVGGETEGIKGGINEKSLVVINASASVLPADERNGEGLFTELLTHCDSVDSVLRKKAKFSKARPGFYMVADRTKIAVIEIGLEGEFSIKETDDGILYHTNHYLDDKLQKFNKNENVSSNTRFNRIKYLLESHTDLFTMEDFIKFSQDRNDGPDNSIWRTGSKPEKNRTLGTWVVAIPKNSPPILYVKFANPNEEEKTYEVILDENFWSKGERKIDFSEQ